MSAEIVAIADGEAEARRALGRCVVEGGVAVFPADGLYGLACDPLNPAAIERIHEIKGREASKPSAVLYFSGLVMRELLGSIGERSREAIGALLPGPYTLVLANPHHRYPLACRQDPERLGVRLLAGPLAGLSSPLFQTSANRSGEPAPSRLDDVDPEVLAEVDLAVDGGELTGLPSTVVDLSAIETGGGWTVLREGAGPLDAVERTLGPP